MSRYLVQMKFSPQFSPQFRTVHITVGRSRMIAERLPKQKEHNRVLTERYAAGGEGQKISFPQCNKHLGQLPYALLLQVCM